MFQLLNRSSAKFSKLLMQRTTILRAQFHSCGNFFALATEHLLTTDKRQMAVVDHAPWII